MDTFNRIILYFFSPVPGRSFLYYIPVFVVMAILVAAAVYILLRIKKSKEDKAFKKQFRGYPANLILVAAIWGLYLLCRFYYVPFFSMRLFIYLLILVTAYVVYALFTSYTKKYPMDKQMRNERDSKNAYLPKKKKK